MFAFKCGCIQISGSCCRGLTLLVSPASNKSEQEVCRQEERRQQKAITSQARTRDITPHKGERALLSYNAMSGGAMVQAEHRCDLSHLIRLTASP